MLHRPSFASLYVIQLQVPMNFLSRLPVVLLYTAAYLPNIRGKLNSELTSSFWLQQQGQEAPAFNHDSYSPGDHNMMIDMQYLQNKVKISPPTEMALSNQGGLSM